jgi:peptidoglycan/xylan/chitin deacetylase (PgdA/CDA1 family)
MDRIQSELLFKYFPSFLNFVKKKKNLIIMYHGIDLKGDNRFNMRHTSVHDFESQILFLKKYCNILSLSDYIDGKFDSTKSNVAITFDDGFYNNYLYAKPLLERYQILATFYITGINKTSEDILWPDFVSIVSTLTNSTFELEDNLFSKVNGVYTNQDNESIYHFLSVKHPFYHSKQYLYSVLEKHSEFKKDASYDDYWKLMTDEQITLTSKSDYISIGSHGFYHNNLGALPIEDSLSELQLSKKYLENLIQKPVDSIGYPDGSYSRLLLDEAPKLGFIYQVAADGYMFEEDLTDNRIHDRKGIYSCDTCGNQLIK